MITFPCCKRVRRLSIISCACQISKRYHRRTSDNDENEYKMITEGAEVAVVLVVLVVLVVMAGASNLGFHVTVDDRRRQRMKQSMARKEQPAKQIT